MSKYLINKKMIEHIVMIKISDRFEADAKQAKAQEIKGILEELPAKIEEIKTYEIGLNISPSPTAYDIVLVSSFETLETLETYRIHKAHQKVLKKIKEYAAATTVVDYRK